MRRPIGAKFCTVIRPRLDFVMLVQNFRGEVLPKNFKGQKHAKFGPISDNFKLWWRISPEGMKIFEIGEVCDRLRFLLCSTKKVQ